MTGPSTSSTWAEAVALPKVLKSLNVQTTFLSRVTSMSCGLLGPGVAVAEDQVAVGEQLERRDPGERDAGQFVLLDAPDDLARRSDLDHAVAVAGGDERVAAGQANRAEDVRAVPFGAVPAARPGGRRDRGRSSRRPCRRRRIRGPRRRPRGRRDNGRWRACGPAACRDGCSGLLTVSGISWTILPCLSTSMIRRLPLSAIIVRPLASRWKAWISTPFLLPGVGLDSCRQTIFFIGRHFDDGRVGRCATARCRWGASRYRGHRTCKAPPTRLLPSH